MREYAKRLAELLPREYVFADEGIYWSISTVRTPDSFHWLGDWAGAATYHSFAFWAHLAEKYNLRASDLTLNAPMRYMIADAVIKKIEELKR